jgi:signal transduction histidine kinase
MRWPIGTAAAVVVGILSTGLLREQLGQAGQAAVFIVAASALPASFLIGQLQRAREAERVAALEASRSRIATAGVEERRRIERDLHDGAQQHLVALLARVELARSEAESGSRLERELTEIGASIRDVHRELRELARGIYPAILTDQGLGAAVASAIGRLPIQAEVEIAPEVDGHRFPAPIEGAAYLFVLEGLTNVMKHSGAERADVRLSRDGASLRVLVRDAGRGFDPALLGPTALQALRDRLGAVGGEFHVQSRPGVGTQLVGVFPVG